MRQMNATFALLLLLGGAIDIVVAEKVALTASTVDRILFPNPYAHIPAQCYIETSGGTQNPCQYCHTDGLAKRRFGNNTPQAGASPVLGNLQGDYAFPALHYPHIANGSINPWENTLLPSKLIAAVAASGHDPSKWDNAGYIRQDNWSPAFARRPGDPSKWDAGVKHPFRLFPGLDPADLPADSDGFVRSNRAGNGLFRDEQGWHSGWRSVNFVPYGIFTPLTGSVSGIYIRLPVDFMRDAEGRFDARIYAQNLELLASAIQDRIDSSSISHYLGSASTVPIEAGLYPLGTEFAHPLHYVDIAADGTSKTPGTFPGMRARRVKEIRYMYKFQPFNPNYGGPSVKEEDAPVRVGHNEGWIDNGAGWILAGYIENASGQLRPQTPSELTQCVGCHSGAGPQDEIAYPDFTSGTGNTIDSTWALPRQLPGKQGWREMDALGYDQFQTMPDRVPGRSSYGDPINRGLGKGEFRHFLETVVGASLYGDMPASIENLLAGTISQRRGYTLDWPAIDTSSAEAFVTSQQTRQRLMRELTARREHLDENGFLQGALLYPTENDALAGAARYRMVVVTQRFDFGKDVFPQTPVTLRYFRTRENAFTHQNGQPYRLNEVIIDRPVDNNPRNVTYGIGVTPTLIERNPDAASLRDYVPLLLSEKQTE